MREMKDSGIEWIGEIPEGWKVARLKRYCKLNTGSTPSTQNSKWFDGDINWFTPGDFTNNYILKESKRKLSKAAEKEGIIKLYPKDINMLVCIGATAGKIGYCGFVAYSNQQVTAICNNEEIYTKYLTYYMVIAGEVINSTSMFTTLPILNNSAVGNFPVLIPDIKVQQAIADFLDAKCSELDALAADIRSQIDTLKEYKKSLITHAVTKGLDPKAEMKDSGIEWIGEIPERWILRKAKYLFKQRNARGNTKKLQLLSPTQQYGVISQSEYEQLTGMKPVKLKEQTDLTQFKTIHSGDYCISLRSFQGGFEYCKTEGVVSPAYQVFYPIVPIADNFYKYLFKEGGFISKMNSYTMSLRDGKNIAFADFGVSVIPYPPLSEQQSIADYLDTKCSGLDALITSKEQQLAALSDYKKSLIYQYVTGKRQVLSK